MRKLDPKAHAILLAHVVLTCVASVACDGVEDDPVDKKHNPSVTSGGGSAEDGPLPEASTASDSGAASDSTPPTPAADAAAPSPSTTTIAAGDIFAQVDPSVPFSTYSFFVAHECAGQTGTFANMGEDGVEGTLLDNTYGKLRFGKVADPQASSRTVLLVRANRNDPLLYSAPRCEISWASSNLATRLKLEEDIWFAFGLHLPAWQTVGEEAIVAQWHESGPTVNPFMAIAIKGDRLKVTLRYNANPSPTQATNTVQVFDLAGPLPINAWSYFVIKAKASWNAASNPYLKVWRDGAQVLDYAGRVGYNSSSAPFMKMGIYPWGSQSGNNAWTPSVPTKTVLFRAPTYVRDTSGKYAEPDLRAYVMAH